MNTDVRSKHPDMQNTAWVNALFGRFVWNILNDVQWEKRIRDRIVRLLFPLISSYDILIYISLYLYNNLKRTVLEALNLHLTASLHGNANLARAGMARAAPARGLTELFLITCFAVYHV